MNYITILGFIGIYTLGGSIAMVPPHNNAIVIPTPPSLPTLAQDLDEIARMIPLQSIRNLVIRYLLNDKQFQDFVRTINSNDAYIAQMTFRSQPEVMRFMIWVRTQIMLSGGELQFEESEEFLSIINQTPYWSTTVFGWQGFANEFLLYFPADMLRNLVQMKVAQNGIFAQFVQRLKDLKPAYDRVSTLPVFQRVLAALQAYGIDIVALDTGIRNQFGWQQLPTVAPVTTPKVNSSTTAAEVSSNLPAYKFVS